MLFSVIDKDFRFPAESPQEHAYLRIDGWNDMYKYRTQYFLVINDRNGTLHHVGDVKIGQFGLLPGDMVKPNTRAPDLPESFDALSNKFFSVGQSETYYEALNILPEDLRLAVLKGLHDIAYNQDQFDKAASEPVMIESLLRSVSETNVRHRYHNLAMGNAELTRFEFDYIFSGNTNCEPLRFIVEPNSVPSTNIHVLIGKNGVGKTNFMKNVRKSLLYEKNSGCDYGEVKLVGNNNEEWSFAGLVSVSFSVFDEFQIDPSKPTSDPICPVGVKASMIGIGHVDPAATKSRNKSHSEIADDFVASLKMCKTGLRKERWITAIMTLCSDPVFASANVISLLDFEAEDWENGVQQFFDRKLSSGHKIVLLTITRLVELVDERTLVLLDEPESHLHPPLLSAFIRSLSNLLIQRNGVAIIATHSPVVLQEVPRSCVWKLTRNGNFVTAERPHSETFGENVGVLTREIFGLEVTRSGFHELISKMVDQNLSYSELVAHFDGQIGAEGRAIARGLIAIRDMKEQS